MARFARRSLPFLLFGMFATVTVAWSVQWWPSSRRTWSNEADRKAWEEQHAFDIDIPKGWPPWIPDDWPAPSWGVGTRDLGWRSVGYAFHDKSRYATPGKVTPPFQTGDVMSYHFGRTEVGWPLRSMMSAGGTKIIFRKGTYPDFERHDRPGVLGFLDAGVRIERPPRGRPRAWFFPLRPLPIGFALDTLFYALLAWLPFGAFVGVRALIRDADGRCPGCGYRIEDLDRCPECGRAARRWVYRES